MSTKTKIISLLCFSIFMLFLAGIYAYLSPISSGDFEQGTSSQFIITSIFITILVLLTTLHFSIKNCNEKINSDLKFFESEVRFKKVLDSLPVGVLVLDGAGKPFYSNNKAQQILGNGVKADANPEELNEINKIYIKDSSTLYPRDKMPLMRALAGEKNIRVEDMEISNDGVIIPLRVSATSIANSEGVIEYVVAVYEDRTEVKEANREIIREKKIAESALLAAEAAHLKEAFIANISHEIRTPMNSIIGFTERLLTRDLGVKENDFVQMIKISGENLLHIINDVLDISKIAAGSMEFEEEPMRIKDMFDSFYMMFLQKAKERNLDLTFECEDNVPDILLGDSIRLTQIINNLVGNAIKFTKKGSVAICAKALSEQDGVYQIEFSVKDSGIGIPEDKLEYIFGRFQQAESHTTRNFGGTGLGLSIARQLVELQGGKITVRSIEGIGSVFTFTLPLKKSTEFPTKIDEVHYDYTLEDITKLNILVVEDNATNVKFITSLFEDYGIAVDIAGNGKEAVEKLKTNRSYDVVLMDIEMPEMNGYEATSVIRNQLKSNIPIIAMTAHAFSGERDKCLRLGMSDYISKPINWDLLFEKIFNTTFGVKQANIPPPLAKPTTPPAVLKPNKKKRFLQNVISNIKSINRNGKKVVKDKSIPAPGSEVLNSGGDVKSDVEFKLQGNDLISGKDTAEQSKDSTFPLDKLAKGATDSKWVNDHNMERVVDLTFFLSSLKGKKNRILDLIDVFLKQIPEDLNAMNKAVAKEDYPVIRQVAHKMKSTVAVMGISILNPVLDQMEASEAAVMDIEKIKFLNDSVNVIFKRAVSEIEEEKVRIKASTDEALLNENNNEMEILLVEDNSLLRKSIAYFLVEKGYKVFEAENGLDAVEMLKKQQFDLMIIDLKMPQLGGMEVIHLVREELKLTTPIIVLTSSGIEEVELESYNIGVNDFIAKPFSLLVLHVRIDKLIRENRKALPGARPQEKVARTMITSVRKGTEESFSPPAMVNNRPQLHGESA